MQAIICPHNVEFTNGTIKRKYVIKVTEIIGTDSKTMSTGIVSDWYECIPASLGYCTIKYWDTYDQAKEYLDKVVLQPGKRRFLVDHEWKSQKD